MAKINSPDGLSDKQRVFVDEYLIDLNATQAAIRAGYSPSSAKTIGHDLTNKNQAVMDLIAVKMAERSRRTGVTQDRIVRELALVGFANAKDIIDPETGRIREGINPEEMACIASVKVKTTDGKIRSEEREIKMQDKMKALELLGKHNGMFKDNVNLLGDEGVNVNVCYIGPKELDELNKKQGIVTEEDDE